jgi:hypothetical protein
VTSSISSLETEVQAKPRTASWSKPVAALLAIVFLVIVGVEIGARLFLARVNKVEEREIAEYRAAVAMRPAGGRKSVLFIGNSLLGLGVDFPVVRESLASGWDARRLYIDSAGYWDFYYALRRLHAEGARYDAVVVFLTPRFMINRAVRGDHFAYRLMRLSDIFSVTHNVALHRTAAANMAFANVSAFYGLRADYRKVLLGHLLPEMPSLAKLAAKATHRPLRDDEIYQGAVYRLRDYRELADRIHTRIYVVMPPQPTAEGRAVVKRAGAEEGITVVGLPQESMTDADFADGFHLNLQGARKFTAALIPELHRMLDAPGRTPGGDAPGQQRGQRGPR